MDDGEDVEVGGCVGEWDGSCTIDGIVSVVTESFLAVGVAASYDGCSHVEGVCLSWRGGFALQLSMSLIQFGGGVDDFR